MIRRLTAGAALAAACFAPMPAHAATVRIELWNWEFRAWSTVAQAGDTIELVNRGSTMTVESYRGQEIGPFTLQTYGSATFVYDGSDTGLRVVGQSNVDGSNCTGMCGNLTTTPPANPPQAPVFTQPAAGATVTENNVIFFGTALNASKVRLHFQQANVTRYAVVDGNGQWTLGQQLSNGPQTVTAISQHFQGFESAPSTLQFTVSGNDIKSPTIAADNPATIAGQPSQVRMGSVYVGHGGIKVTGVVTDDVQTRKVSATVSDYFIPDTTYPVSLTCTQPGGEHLSSCSSASNPARVQYRGNHLVPRPGLYTLRVTAEDGVGNVSVVTMDVMVLSHML